jgi:hypothetical protein
MLFGVRTPSFNKFSQIITSLFKMNGIIRIFTNTLLKEFFFNEILKIKVIECRASSDGNKRF